MMWRARSGGLRGTGRVQTEQGALGGRMQPGSGVKGGEPRMWGTCPGAHGRSGA